MTPEYGVWVPDFLEIRQSGTSQRLVGSFPYGGISVRARTGKVRKERINPGAFDFAVEQAEREINLLLGHDFDKPLASKLAGTLELKSSAKALTFTATLPEVERQPTWMRDATKSVEAGLVRGISPGFFVPPRSVVPNAERLVPEPGNPSVLIRDVNDAVLFELSLVTRPAYDSTTVALIVGAEAERQAEQRRETPIWL